MTSFDDRIVGGICSLAIRDYGGSGTPILLIHGLTRSAREAAVTRWRAAAGPFTVADQREAGTSAVVSIQAYGAPDDVVLTTSDRSVRRLPDGKYVISPGADAFARILDSLTAMDWFAVFGKVRVPFLIYHCVVDVETALTVGPVAEIRAACRQGRRRDLVALAAQSPNTRVRTLESHHMPLLTEPDLLSAEIGEFINAATGPDRVTDTHS